MFFTQQIREHQKDKNHAGKNMGKTTLSSTAGLLGILTTSLGSNLKSHIQKSFDSVTSLLEIYSSEEKHTFNISLIVIRNIHKLLL